MPLHDERIREYVTQPDTDLERDYKAIANIIEQGIPGRQAPQVEEPEDDDDEHEDDDDNADNVAGVRGMQPAQVIQAATQQIQMGEKYLRDQVAVNIPAEQTGTGQPFILDNMDTAQLLIKDGEITVAAVNTYTYLIGEADRDEIVDLFMREAKLDLFDERERLRAIYGNRVPEGYPEEETEIKWPDVDWDADFEREGW
jgi:hypothetical protein